MKYATNADGLKLVFSTVSQNRLAIALGLPRQSLGRWSREVPLVYVLGASIETGIPVEKIVPELERRITAILGKPSAGLLPELIKAFTESQRRSPIPAKR